MQNQGLGPEIAWLVLAGHLERALPVTVSRPKPEYDLTLFAEMGRVGSETANRLGDVLIAITSERDLTMKRFLAVTIILAIAVLSGCANPGEN